LFTDLTPGLFTHVEWSQRSGGRWIPRFMIVDVPERGEKVRGERERFISERTLHYFFLRDTNAKSAGQMRRRRPT